MATQKKKEEVRDLQPSLQNTFLGDDALRQNRAQEQTISELKSALDQQQKEIKALTARATHIRSWRVLAPSPQMSLVPQRNQECGKRIPQNRKPYENTPSKRTTAKLPPLRSDRSLHGVSDSRL